MRRAPFSLTTNIVLLVAVMGMASGLVTGYVAWHMQRMESQYLTLLHQQAEVSSTISQMRHQLTSAATMAHTTLHDRTSNPTLHAPTELAQLQRNFNANLTALAPLLPDEKFMLAGVAAQGQRVFSSALGNPPDGAALDTLSRDFLPGLTLLQETINTLQANAQRHFAASAQALQVRTQRALHIALFTGWGSVLLLSALAAWFARRFISRPLARLARNIRLRHYGTSLADLARRDEIGSLAHALQQFVDELQAAQAVEHKRALQQENKFMEEQLRQLTSALPGAVFQLQLPRGAPLQLRFLSPQWVEIFGLPRDTASDTATAALMLRQQNPQFISVTEQRFAQSAQTLESVDFEVAVHMFDDVTRWLKIRANPVMQDNDCVIFNGVLLDITKEYQQAQALKKAKAQAENNAQARTTLQASISHEIRTPLNAILGLTQLVLKTDLPETQREQLHNVLRAAQHLRGIVNEVLDFSKIDAGQLKLESTDFSLENVVLDAIRMCREEANKKNLEIHHTIASNISDHLRGDPHRIAQILLNYLNNAIKFTEAGHIHVDVQLDPDSTLHRIVLRLSVTDTGPGIPADRLPLLFEAFQQADNSITRRFGGTGLGLTISRALAQLMGGTAGVESVFGKGSTFWFTAVLEPARTLTAAPSAPPLPPTSQVGSWRGQRVLVVDDNPLNRAVAEGMLHALGLRTEVAEDGTQALFKLQAVGPKYYSCVLMDIQMPHMDGLSATKMLREMADFADLPIIAMTAHTGIQDVQNTQEAGMNAHLSKPLLESALHDTLQQWLSPATPGSTENSTAPKHAPEEVPVLFDASAIDALVKLFDPGKLQQLIEQFVHDSLQRAHALSTLVQKEDWQAMRAETHKLTGTAATFGLLQLGYWSAALSAALKAGDAVRIQELVQCTIKATNGGVDQLQEYLSTSRAH